MEFTNKSRRLSTKRLDALSRGLLWHHASKQIVSHVNFRVSCEKALVEVGGDMEAAVDWLHELFSKAPVERSHRHAREVGPVGHFGFFRPAAEESLWLEAARFLEGARSIETAA